MEKISSLITQQSVNSTEQLQSVTGKDRTTVEALNKAAFSKGSLKDHHFDRLWQRMIETYGNKWTSNYGFVPNQSWIDGLADMCIEDIITGLHRLKSFQNDEGWPPTLLQFRDLCRPQRTQAQEFYKPQVPKLSFGDRKEMAEKAFGDIKSKLAAGLEASGHKMISKFNPDDPNSGCTCPLVENKPLGTCPVCKDMDQRKAHALELLAIPL